MKDYALTLGGSTNTGGAGYELSMHFKSLLNVNIITTHLALTCAPAAPTYRHIHTTNNA